jgi:hypothetical protein
MISSETEHEDHQQKMGERRRMLPKKRKGDEGPEDGNDCNAEFGCGCNGKAVTVVNLVYGGGEESCLSSEFFGTTSLGLEPMALFAGKPHRPVMPHPTQYTDSLEEAS